MNIKDAEKKITSYIKKLHNKKVYKVNLLELIINLKLPVKQVETIMNGFIKRGRVKEI